MKTDKNNVLIVDDETANIIALTNILSRDYNVYAAKSGASAIKVANDSLPDVILLDVLMPDMDGYEVIAELKNTERTMDIPVIFITGLDNIDAEKKGLALGAADYIPKPFSTDIVRLRVHNQLKIVNNTRALDEQLKQQALVTKISNSFLTDSYIDSLFSDTLRTVGEFMGINRVLLYNYEADGSVLTCRSEWVKPELNAETRIGSKLELKEPVTCTCSDNECIKSPIFIKGEMFALLEFSREGDGAEWSESEIHLAVIVANIFSGVFERDAMERQFSIVEKSPNLILSLTPDGSVEYVNHSVKTLIGYAQVELLTKGLGLIFDEKTLGEINRKFIPEAMSGSMVSFEIDALRKDGEKRRLTTSVFRTGKNTLGMIIRDLTEIRELEANLISAKELAEHSSRAKSEFLARMSHEMRTPMNAIMGMLQIAKMRGIPPNIKEYYDEIDTASRHLLRMIDDVLDISGMEYGMFKLNDSDFDAGAMFGDVLQTAGRNASTKQQAFVSDVDPAIPAFLNGDEKRLKQVMTTLLANAVKFTQEHGEIRFRARVAEKEDAEKLTLRIEVADNGIGISEEQQQNLFQIFEQADGSNTRKHGGIGIGLALSKRIVEMMGGDIWVESEPGKGAKFTFTCKIQKKP